MAKKLKSRFVKNSEDDLIEKFAAVFHSFRALHHVTPLAFLAKLKRRGVALSAVSSQTRGER